LYSVGDEEIMKRCENSSEVRKEAVGSEDKLLRPIRPHKYTHCGEA